MEYCYFDAENDAVAIKSGMNEDGWRVGLPSENVIIRHCRASGGRWGGVSFGSDMSGDIHRVFIHDVHFADTNRGINFKSTRGRGGTVEHIWIQDILLEGIRNDPLRLDTWYRAWFGSDAGAAPTFRAISVRDMTARNFRKAFHIRGLPERPIENLCLENISITEAVEPAEVTNVRDLRMRAVSVQLKEQSIDKWNILVALDRSLQRCKLIPLGIAIL